MCLETWGRCEERQTAPLKGCLNDADRHRLKEPDSALDSSKFWQDHFPLCYKGTVLSVLSKEVQIQKTENQDFCVSISFLGESIKLDGFELHENGVCLQSATKFLPFSLVDLSLKIEVGTHMTSAHPWWNLKRSLKAQAVVVDCRPSEGAYMTTFYFLDLDAPSRNWLIHAHQLFSHHQ